MLAAETDPMSLASAGVIKTEDNDYCVQTRYSSHELKMGDCGNSDYNYPKKFYWDGNETIRSGGTYSDIDTRCWEYNTDTGNDDYTALTMEFCDDTKTNQQACMVYACAW